MNTYTTDDVILLKLNANNLNLKELPSDPDERCEIYEWYSNHNRVKMDYPLDTHYVMDGEYIVFIGNKDELLGFLNSHY